MQDMGKCQHAFCIQDSKYFNAKPGIKRLRQLAKSFNLNYCTIRRKIINLTAKCYLYFIESNPEGEHNFILNTRLLNFLGRNSCFWC